jgi:hypothetical protein
LDPSGRGHGGKDLPRRGEDGKGVGHWNLAECRVVRGPVLLWESGLRAHRTPRFEALCRIPDYAESSMKHLHLALS